MPMNVNAFPEFQPHPLVRGGHAQTLLAYVLPGRRFPYRAQQRRVDLDDGDAIMLHDDEPSGWHPGDRTALLIHGLAGCHGSGYMIRIAGKLNEAGVRVFRMDQRGCGAGAGLARLPYHAGRSEDPRAALEFISELCPGSGVSLVGFSIGGNIALKLLGENLDRLPHNLTDAIAVNPCIDLAQCARRLARLDARPYDRYFAKLLVRRVDLYDPPDSTIGSAGRTPRPRCLRDFDSVYTAPLGGFRSVDDYYARSSAAQFIPNICLPTRILTARDDPIVPVCLFENLPLPPAVRLCVAESGGHLGYFARRGIDPDRRWMDWRIVDWVTAASPID